jgi:polar amino acid transport system ATP-binding protein
MRASQNELFTRSEPGTVVVIRKFATEHSLTMIMVTHQIGFAREISDRVCFSYEGRIAEESKPDRLFTDPQNPRTQQFLNAVLQAD